MTVALSDAVTRQREYYSRTAGHYDSMHLHEDDEHGVALAAFGGLAELHGVQSILDVGAGTGRGVERLSRRFPEARITGVEPSEELRAVGHRRGVSETCLQAGDALALPFADDAFDFVIETGVLHHIADCRIAIAEMVRTARVGVMISDSNVYGQGGRIVRTVKQIIRSLGLWRTMIWIQTRGKMHKWSEGDGVYYSFSPFDHLDIIRRKFPQVHVMSTGRASGPNAVTEATHVMIVAVRKR